MERVQKNTRLNQASLTPSCPAREEGITGLSLWFSRVYSYLNRVSEGAEISNVGRHTYHDRGVCLHHSLVLFRESNVILHQVTSDGYDLGHDLRLEVLRGFELGLERLKETGTKDLLVNTLLELCFVDCSGKKVNSRK